MKKSVATKEEKAWMRELEKLLKNPPGTRIGFYTIGDASLNAYDLTKEDQINAMLDLGKSDFCQCVAECKASLGWVDSKMQIHSTAG